MIMDLRACTSTFPLKSELLGIGLHRVNSDAHRFDVGRGWKGTHWHIGPGQGRWRRWMSSISTSSTSSTSLWDRSLRSLLDCSGGISDVLQERCRSCCNCLSVASAASGAISGSGGEQLSGETGSFCVFPRHERRHVLG